MATGLVIHISSGKDKHTEVLTDKHIRIGSCDDCDVHLRSSSLPKGAPNDQAVLELTRTNGFYRVANFDESLGLTHNGQPLEPNAEIQDGDEVSVGGLSTGPSVLSDSLTARGNKSAGCAKPR